MSKFRTLFPTTCEPTIPQQPDQADLADSRGLLVSSTGLRVAKDLPAATPLRRTQSRSRLLYRSSPRGRCQASLPLAPSLPARRSPNPARQTAPHGRSRSRGPSPQQQRCRASPRPHSTQHRRRQQSGSLLARRAISSGWHGEVLCMTPPRRVPSSCSVRLRPQQRRGRLRYRGLHADR